MLQGSERHTAAKLGHLDCLKCLHEYGVKFVYGNCLVAVEHKHIHCVKYILEVGGVNPRDCPSCSITAAENGDMQMLRYCTVLAVQLLPMCCPLLLRSITWIA